MWTAGNEGKYFYILAALDNGPGSEESQSFTAQFVAHLHYKLTHIFHERCSVSLIGWSVFLQGVERGGLCRCLDRDSAMSSKLVSSFI